MSPPSDVLIVGAGPAGLVTAIVLAERGVAVRVVDRNTGPVVESRAAIVHVRTLELFDRLGVAGRAVARGVPITLVEVVERGRRLGEIPLGGPAAGETPFPFALGLAQNHTEHLLVERLGEFGVRVERRTELVGLTRTAEGARAVVRGTDGGEEVIAARWVVGADGAHSAVRRALDVRFPGSTYGQTGLLADVRLGSAAPRSGGIRLHLTSGGFVGVLPLAADRHRIFGAVPPGIAPPEADRDYAGVEPAELQRWLETWLDTAARIDRVEWTALFRVHSRIAARFRAGPAFLVGDAAHLHSPAGGQGMNLAVGDAVNLGWKLAAVATGAAREDLLASYEDERRPVARRVLRGTDRGFALETTAHPAAVWARAHLAGRLLAPLLRLGAVRAAVARLFSQTWVGYRGSPVVSGRPAGRRGLRPGDRVPPGRAAWPSDLRHHVLLVDGAAEPVTPSSAAAVRSLLARYAVDAGVHRISGTRRAAPVPWLLLVRPDGHLGYTGPVTDLTGLGDHLDRIYLRR